MKIIFQKQMYTYKIHSVPYTGTKNWIQIHFTTCYLNCMSGGERRERAKRSAKSSEEERSSTESSSTESSREEECGEE